MMGWISADAKITQVNLPQEVLGSEYSDPVISIQAQSAHRGRKALERPYNA
jgi:hypothetical protein